MYFNPILGLVRLAVICKHFAQLKSDAPTVKPSQRPRLESIFNPVSPPIQAPKVTLHISQFEGGSALSPFRIQQLLPSLQAIQDKINEVAARFVHLVSTDAEPTLELQDQLAALLTYGDPYAGPTDGPLIVVSPR